MILINEQEVVWASISLDNGKEMGVVWAQIMHTQWFGSTLFQRKDRKWLGPPLVEITERARVICASIISSMRRG